ncbi:hypothetical protein L2E82_50478 [Cichorium intybus]|nr:hypothetical protein L2E82_50478 [Cichorium intybus]
MDLDRFVTSQGSCAGFEGERACESVRLAREHAQALAVEGDGFSWLMALSKAADDGVPVISDWEGNVTEDVNGVEEAARGRGGGAKFKEFGTRERVEVENTGGDEVSLELFDMGEVGALLQ